MPTQLERQRAVLEAALQLREDAGVDRILHTREAALRTPTACSNHSLIMDIEGLTGRSGRLSHLDAVTALSETSSNSQLEGAFPAVGPASLLQTRSLEKESYRHSVIGNIVTKPFANCKCEEYACTCSKACGCKLTGDGGSKLVKKLNPRISAGELIGQGAARGQKPFIPDYNFRCSCSFDVEQSVVPAGVAGSGGGEERTGLATADGSMRCGCGSGQCECRRVCRCDTQSSASLLQEAATQDRSRPRRGARRREHRRPARQQSRQDPLQPQKSPSPVPVDAGWDSGAGPGGARGVAPPGIDVSRQLLGAGAAEAGAAAAERVPRFVEDAATRAIRAAHAGSSLSLHLPA